MRCSLLLTAALLIAPAFARAEEKTAETEAEPAAPAIEIPVAIGQSVRGIRLPHYDKGGDKLSLRLNADSAERASETKFSFQGLRIEIFDESADKPAMEVVLDRAVFDRDTNLLTSENRAVIRGETFQITGSRLEFDSNTRSSRILGPVSMTISQMEEAAAP
jgi:lipopolysaccharide export system protein LptC